MIAFVLIACLSGAPAPGVPRCQPVMFGDGPFRYPSAEACQRAAETWRSLEHRYTWRCQETR
jgi:hypothetical protein